MTPAERAVIAAAVRAVRAGRALYLAVLSKHRCPGDSLSEHLGRAGMEGMAQVNNSDAELALGEAVDVLERERGFDPVVNATPGPATSVDDGDAP